MTYLAAMNRLHVDMIRTFLGTKSAIGAGIVVLGHVKDLELRLRVKYLQKITRKAESSQKYGPRNIRSKRPL